MAGKRVRYENLTGGINKVSSIGTINQTPNRTESPEAYNVEYFGLGGIMSQKGNTQYGNTQIVDDVGDPISCGIEYKKNNIRYMVITTRSGAVKIYNPTTEEFDTLYQFDTATDRHSIELFDEGLVISNGVDDLLYYEHGRNDLLTGTVSGTAGGTTLTGTSTLFKTELHVGEYIAIDGETTTYRVTELTTSTTTENTVCYVTPSFTTNITSKTFNLTPISRCNAILVNSEDTSVSKTIRGLAIKKYKGRLFVGGNDGTLYYSQLDNVFGWDVKYFAGGIDAFYNDSSDILALGLYREYLLIHRQDYTYDISGDTDPDTWVIKPFADVSCESQQSFVCTNNAYFVYSRKNQGIYPLMQQTIFTNNVLGNELSVKIRNAFSSIDVSKLDEIYCVALGKKRWMLFYMPFLEGNYSNIAWIFDFQTKSWLKRIVPQRVTCAFSYYDNLYIGTADGKILKEFEGLTFDGDVIPFSYKTPWFDFGDGSTFTTIGECRIQISEDDNNEFRFRVRRDGTNDYIERTIKNKSGTKSTLIWSDDYGLLIDTVWDDYEWSDGGFTTYRFPPANAYFQSYQLELCGNLDTESTATEGMAVYGFEFNGIRPMEAMY